MDTLYEVLVPLAVAIITSTALYFWRKGPFSLAMFVIAIFALLQLLVTLAYVRWIFDPFAYSEPVLYLVTTAASITFYIFWIAVPLLALAHLAWLVCRKKTA